MKGSRISRACFTRHPVAKIIGVWYYETLQHIKSYSKAANTLKRGQSANDCAIILQHRLKAKYIPLIFHVEWN